jgi:uroporphyrinogen-III synthase
LKAKNILVAKKGTEKKNKKAVAKKVAVKTKTVTKIAKATKAKDTKPAKLAVKSTAAKKTVAAKKVSTKKVVVVKKTAVAAPKKTKNIENLAVKSKVVKAKVAKGKAVEVQVVTAEPIRVNTAPPTPRNKVKSILVTQPKPEGEKSPYFDLAKKCNIKVDFREFIHVEGISATDFRRDRINILDYSAVIFTSRNAADHYFRICQEMRITVPETMKYFCISESTAYYLQKYVIFRKRKIFHGKQTFADMMDVIKKHKDDKFLLPCTDIANIEGAELLEKAKIRYAKAVIYKTVCSDLSDLANVNYDVIVFFSPSGVKSLFQNFPDFKQNLTRIAAFGATTAKAVEDADLYVDIKAPNPLAPSMTMALEQYITAVNKGK